MRKGFFEKVKREGIYDTKKYRYVYEANAFGRLPYARIKRIPIEWLDTIKACDDCNWETAKIFIWNK